MAEWFPDQSWLAAIVSIILNIVVAISGVLPSAFITAGTVGVLGFQTGLVILIFGEAAGAMISFLLYRKGVHTFFPKVQKIKLPLLQRLQNTEGAEAFLLVILLRLLPFVPSGIVTLTAAISKMKFLPFSIASTAGKIPALFIEAYSVYHVLNLKWEWQLALILIIILLYLLYVFLKRKK